MKIGIMGGTFDPIHLGHLIAAESAREAAGLDEVWFIPTFIPPHKSTPPKASAEMRLAMVQLAIADHPSFKAVDYEIVRGGASYTVDTVQMLKEKHPGISFYYLIGADMVMYLPKWMRIEEIIQGVSFIGLQRPGFEVELDQLPKHLADKVQIAVMPQIDISSTSIRERISLGQSIRYRVCEQVRVYMEANRLYES
jgi:nicotinate-nucleotide adenylyltransferase